MLFLQLFISVIVTRVEVAWSNLSVLDGERRTQIPCLNNQLVETLPLTPLLFLLVGPDLTALFHLLVCLAVKLYNWLAQIDHMLLYQSV
jgi:hypothetical protein